MATTITSGASTITPTLVLDYGSERESQSIVHRILGVAAPDVTLRPALLRSGSLNLGFHGSTAQANSKTAADLLSTAATFNLVSTDLSTIPMAFVVQGRVSRNLEDESRNAWLVSFDYQETA